MKPIFKIMLCILGASASSSLSAPLKDVYAEDFLMGTALGSRGVNHQYVYPMRQNKKERDVVAREFNCITAENLMKMEYLQPKEGFFNFDQADEFMAFCEESGLAVVGHALVWHSQTPDWLFKDDAGNPVTREVLIERMRNHIHTVVGRYKGRIKYWDVVNEAIDTKMVVDESLPLDEEGNPQKKRVAFYRDSPWLQIIGEDYIELAFRFAHEADPEARLLYNDYSMANRAKVEFAAGMVRGLKAKGVPIHGVGMQAHWQLDYPEIEQLQDSIDILAATGLKVSITELDIGVLPRASEYHGADVNRREELRAELNPYSNSIPMEVLNEQAEKYRAVFEVFRKNSEHIERVTVWGVSDRYTWKANWPVPGRTAYPLLFDRNFQPKPAYYALQKPNIVVIICDDLNDSIAGMGGHPQASTPNIDRLAKRGVRFTNAASNCPLCGPSRASLWSGLHPTTTGYYGYKQQINHWKKNPKLGTAATLFEHFTANGYRNFATGKIHHNGHEDFSIFENSDGFPGFGTKGNFGPLPNDGKPENLQQGVLPPWMPAKLRKEGGWGDGFGPIQDLKPYGDEYGWTMFYDGKPWQFRNGHDRDPMPDEVCAAEAVAFLEKKHEAPFLLTIGFTRPHSPWYAPQEYFDLFPLESVELAPILENDAADCAKILTEQEDIAQPWGWEKYRTIMNNGGDEQLRKWTQAYLACVAFVDDQTGKVLDALEQSPYAANTIIVFTSDHGYHMGEKEYLFKYSPWEESVRIPLVVSGPGVATNQACTTPVSLIDLYPTFIDYARLPEPHKLDGFSLRPLLEHPEVGKWDGPAFSLAASASTVPVEQNVPANAADQHFSLRTERYRYIHCRNGEEELYDHRNDPHEWKNLAGNPESEQVLRAFRCELKKVILVD
ncbi:endo-1,4-beta-xylanase [Pontiella sulfatireligans]|uniref:Beta-xylanase n=1 Tax=Pontiella sulfatireligans TaxID=2750658 RepID=A0A6C2UQ98_9BACT|nr:endo-1,4-beta-xylanase [Pontiella sulfatireligans]SPS74487.1 sulfatase S1_7 [Kiritimatiellales bacterium]VGO22113.1 Endo-1,4-beta-xylanase A [Pontiella sulfatireligans]